MKKRVLRVLACLLLPCLAVAAEPAAPVFQQTLSDFDQVRALAMRALMRAQDLRCIYLYGRGFGLDMPDAVAEDLLIEGLQVFEHLYALDVTSEGLVSYRAANQHPNLGEEYAAFTAFLPEAAAKTVAYYDKVDKQYAEALAKVQAAAAQQAPVTLQTIARQPWTDQPIQQVAGDGFRLGWNWPLLPQAGSTYARHLQQHEYSRDRLLQLAVEAGIDYVRPDDPNLFEWPDVETAEGQYDWSRIDDVLGLLKKYNLAVYVAVPVSMSTAPDWLVQKLGPAATLGEAAPVNRWEQHFFMGMKNTRDKLAPPNLFQAEVAAAFQRYCTALVQHVKASGVRVQALDFVPARAMPDYRDAAALERWRAWLKRRYGDAKLPWGGEVTAATAELPKADLAAATDAGLKRQQADLVRWREDELIAYLKVGVDAVRQAAPEIPLCVFYGENMEFNDSMNGRSHERLVRELNLVPFAFTPGENFYDHLRESWSPLHITGCTTHTGSGNAFAQYAFSSYMHDALFLHTWPSPITRGFYWGDCFLYPDLRWRWSALNSWRRFQVRAQGMAPEMLNTRPTPAVAMLWSDTTNKFQAFIRDYVGGTYGFRPEQANYHRVGCIGWDRLLDGMSMPYDLVTEAQVQQGKLAGYRLLVMPSVQALPVEVAERIRQFVRDGGLVVATSAPALYGDDLEPRGPGQLADVFGADHLRFLGLSVVAETPMGTPRREVWVSPWGPNPPKAQVNSDSLATLFCCYQPREGAQVLEKFTSGEPAVVLNTFGKGKAVVIGYPIGRESFLCDIYHEHYGHNWADFPYGPNFHQELMTWLEQLWPKLGFERDVLVAEEIAPRAIARDAGWPSRLWPRQRGGYQDFAWKTGSTRWGQYPPRSVEVGLRSREGNPNTYLTLYNREGAYGYDPGVIEFESTSKDLAIELGRLDVARVYDLSLGCPVPVKKQRSLDGRRDVMTFRTTIEPAMGKMLVLATDNTVRLYEGQRQRGRADAPLLDVARRLAIGKPAPKHVTIGEADIVQFLVAQAPKGFRVSCESEEFLPAAEKLAAALQQSLGATARVTRTAPHILGQHGGINSCVEAFEVAEAPDIILGNREESHHLAKEEISYGLDLDHNPRLPIVTSRAFPGPGRSVLVMLRPFNRKTAKPEEAGGRLFLEEPAPTAVVVGATETTGMAAGVDRLLELVKKAKKQLKK